MQHEVAIIGAGPIGLELAVALKRAAIDYVHLDASQIGHTISWFAPQTRFFSSNQRIAIAGVPLDTPDGGKATREQYLSYLRTVVELFDLKVQTYEPVTNIEKSADGFRLTTSKSQIAAKKIILATGGTARPRRLNIPGEDLPHVSHYFHDPHTYFRTNLVIVGGKNSAVEAALRSYHAGANVTLSYRRDKFPDGIKYWLLPEITGLIASREIVSQFNTTPVAITRDHITLGRVDGATFDVPANFVLLLIGYEADMTLHRLAGVELLGDSQTPRHNPETMETNAPGVYVAGTAVAGTQYGYKLFIENCHIHVDRIMAALTGHSPPKPAVAYMRPES